MPPPEAIRKSKQQNIAKSVRASLTIYQNPCVGRNSSGIFVVAIAVEMTISSGMAAIRVLRPNNTSKPLTINRLILRSRIRNVLRTLAPPRFASMNGRWIWSAPMVGQRLSGPHSADPFCVVANRECGTTTRSACADKFGTSQRNKKVAHKAPAICATTNNGTSDGRIPAKVSDKERAIVTAGFAKEVDAVNQ